MKTTGPKKNDFNRIANGLRQKGYDIIAFWGCLTVEQILEAISIKAQTLGLDYAGKIFDAFDESTAKLSWYLEQFLLEQKLAIMFNDFEENQDEEKDGEFKQGRLKEFLWLLRDRLENHETVLLFSTQHPLPGFDAPGMTKNIPEFRETLPRRVNERQRNLLDVLAVYGKPVPKEALAAHHLVMEEEDRAALTDLSLLECIDWGEGELFYVHRSTAQYLLETMTDADRKNFRQTAARYFEAIPEEMGKPYLHQRIEARRYYLLAAEWDRAAEITVDMSSYLIDRGYLLGAMELLREMESKELTGKNRAPIHSRIGNIYNEYGEHDQALAQYTQALDIAEKINDLNGASQYRGQIGNIYFKTRDYDRAFDQYCQALEIGAPDGISNILNQIGIVYHIKGDNDAALNSLKQAREINEKTGNRLEVGRNLRQIGMFYYDKKDYDAAWASFQESMDVYGEIAHFKGVKGVASILHWLGLICHARGDDDGALAHFHKANEELQTIADFKDMFYNFYQLGVIYHDKGDSDAALTHYRKSLEICENIGYTKGLADSMARIGALYFQQGEYQTALEYFLQAFKHYTGIAVPDANRVKEEIGRVRGKLPEEQFNAILQEFGVAADSFDNGDDREQEEFVEFLAALAREALAAREKSSEEKEQLSARLAQLIERLSDDEEGRDLKAYFRLLLAVANGSDYRKRLDEVSEELRELFEETKV